MKHLSIPNLCKIALMTTLLGSCAASPTTLIQPQTIEQQIFERPVGIEPITFTDGWKLITPESKLPPGKAWWALSADDYQAWKRFVVDAVRHKNAQTAVIEAYEQQVIFNNKVGE